MDQAVVAEDEVFVADAGTFDGDAVFVALQLEPIAAHRPHVVLVDDGRGAQRVHQHVVLQQGCWAVFQLDMKVIKLGLH